MRGYKSLPSLALLFMCSRSTFSSECTTSLSSFHPLACVTSDDAAKEGEATFVQTKIGIEDIYNKFEHLLKNREHMSGDMQVCKSKPTLFCQGANFGTVAKPRRVRSATKFDMKLSTGWLTAPGLDDFANSSHLFDNKSMASNSCFCVARPGSSASNFLAPDGHRM